MSFRRCLILKATPTGRPRPEPYRQAIAAHLSTTVLPDLERHVVTSRLMTPLDFQERLCAWRGAAFGLEPVLLQSAWFRPHNRSEDIAGLYLVGAGYASRSWRPGRLVHPPKSSIE